MIQQLLLQKRAKKKKPSWITFTPSSFSKAPKHVISFSDYGHGRTFIVTEPVKGRNVPAIIKSAITRNPTGSAITFFFHHQTKILMVNSVHWNYRGGDNYEKWSHENSKSALKTPEFLGHFYLFSWQAYIPFCISCHGFLSIHYFRDSVVSLRKRSSSLEGWLSHEKISWIFHGTEKQREDKVKPHWRAAIEGIAREKPEEIQALRDSYLSLKDNTRALLLTELPLVRRKSTFRSFFVPGT